MARGKRKNSPTDAAASAERSAGGRTGAARGAKKSAAKRQGKPKHAAGAGRTKGASPRHAASAEAKSASSRPAEGADEASAADAGRKVVDASGNAIDLAQIRIRIDSVDEKIHEFISERAKLAQLVGISKAKDGLKTVDFYRPEREAQVLRMAKARNKGPLRDEEVLRLFREIMSACLAQQEPLKVAYLGPEGTFTQAAVMSHFGHSVRGLALSAIDEVFHEVEAGNADFGVVPIENSTEGTINNTLDRFLNSPLKICGEVELRIHHNLMGDLSSLDQIKRICSHPQALAQCRAWLEEHLPDVERVPVSSNAEGARRARDEKGTAAIAGEAAAEVYKLKILAAEIEDRADNTTRFFVLGRKLFKSSGNDRTTLLISVGRTDTSGALFHLLEPLSRHKVNMTRIESRPSHKRKWDYVFFIDIDGHADDEHVAEALEALKERASLFRVLGSYPRAVL
ncbi:MAG: prephenate dehydratase [Gammaproteobacteria bacterium]